MTCGIFAEKDEIKASCFNAITLLKGQQKVALTICTAVTEVLLPAQNQKKTPSVSVSSPLYQPFLIIMQASHYHASILIFHQLPHFSHVSQTIYGFPGYISSYVMSEH